jgi:hypothetical protein
MSAERHSAEYVPQNRCASCSQHLLVGKLQTYIAELEQQVGQMRASLAENTRVFDLIARNDGSQEGRTDDQ